MECVKYQIHGQKACSVLITATKPNGTKLEGEQVFSYVNGKMFVFSMVGKKANLDGYLPTFRTMLTSFKSPPDTPETTNTNNTGSSSLGTPLGQQYKSAPPSSPLFQSQIPNTVPQAPPYQQQPYQQQPYPFQPDQQQQPNNNYALPRILSQSAYIDSIGTVHIVGEVINQSPVTAKFVQITVTFCDANNRVVGTDFTFTQPSDLAPGQRAPFDIAVLSGGIPMAQVRNYALSVDAS